MNCFVIINYSVKEKIICLAKGEMKFQLTGKINFKKNQLGAHQNYQLISGFITSLKLEVC